MSTTKLDVALDAVHGIASTMARATRRRRKIRREHIVAAVNVGASVVSALASVLPQARPVAGVLGALQQTAPLALLPKEEAHLLAKVQTIEAELAHATGERKTRLEAQRDLVLKLIEEQEQRR